MVRLYGPVKLQASDAVRALNFRLPTASLLTSNPHHFHTSTFCAPDSVQGQEIFSAFQLILRDLPQRFRTSIFSDISLRHWTLIFQVQALATE